MEMTKQSALKRAFASVVCLALVLVAVVLFSGCGEKPLYNLDFSGGAIRYNNEDATVKGATWKKCANEEGFEAVYKLTGVVPYQQFVGDKIYGGLDYNIVLIKFTSDSVTKVAHNDKDNTGFYNILDKGTENERVKTGAFDSSATEAESKTTYFFYKKIDNTVRTFTMNISFDGKEEHEVAYKFIIDPANYTLEPAPTTGE